MRQTWEEFVTDLFSAEECEECGGGAANHEPAIVLGNWFAVCRVQCPGCPEGYLVNGGGDYDGHCSRHYATIIRSDP